MVSVIVPVYNTEKYLAEAINSVLDQTCQEWELLLINDGSSDRSLEICRKFESEDPRIRVIDKKNGGVSSARNLGMEEATGDWLCFLDGDDWLERTCLETALNEADEETDIVCWNYWKNIGDIQIANQAIRPSRIVVDEVERLVKLPMFPQYAPRTSGKTYSSIRGVCTKLIRRKLTAENGLWFNENVKIGEDALFSSMCFQKARRVIFTDRYLYHYRLDNVSATRRCRADVKEVYLSMLRSFQNITKNSDDPDTELCYGGLTYDCVARAMEKYYFHPDNKAPLKERLLALKGYLGEQLIQSGISGIQDMRIFYVKQKLVIFCIRHRWTLGLYILSLIKQNFKGQRKH